MVRSIKYRLLALGLLGLSLGACAPTLATRGNLTEAERLAEIRVGVSRREDVAGLLGTPSTIGTFNEDVWYYIGQRTEKTAFFKPTVIERKVVAVRFDKQGVVEKIDQLGKDDGQQVELVDRRTPTAGRDLNFLEQILGNVGRFPGAKSAAPQP